MLPPLILLLSLALAPGAAPQNITYHVTLPSPGSGLVQVRIDLPDPPAPRTLVMPRAIPMGYGEQPYDRFVSRVRASGPGGEPLEVEREEGPRWRVRGRRPIRSITYYVDVARMEREILSAADASRSRSGYVGMLGYSLLAFIEGLEDRRLRLEVHAPGDWPVFSTLAPAAPPPLGSITAEAPDFYALADSQVAMGPDLRVVRVGTVPALFVAAYAEADLDLDTVGRIGRESLDAVIDYLGTAPFPHYTIHMEILKPISPEHEYGFSMEHLDSGTFFLGTEHGLVSGSPERQIERTRYNFAHHIAHSWIPKRCHGKGYFPHTWELAPVLDTIWFSEGFVQYAAIAALAGRRADGDAYRKRMIESRFRKALEEAPPFLRRMTAVELSRVSSTRYGVDFRTGRSSFSRGGMMAAAMDDAIREATGGTKNLRDALRHLYSWCAGRRGGFTLEELPGILEEGTGVDVRSIYQEWLAAPLSPDAGSGSEAGAAGEQR